MPNIPLSDPIGTVSEFRNHFGNNSEILDCISELCYYIADERGLVGHAR